MIEVSPKNELARRWEDTNMTLAAFAAHRHIPLNGTFELTPLCNLKCKMCYVRLDKRQQNAIGRELTAKEWISLAEEAFKAGTLNLLLTGGEPLLREDFTEIYTALCKIGFIITLYTNATLITPETIKLFSKYPPTATAVTVYGSKPETYEKICGDGSAFGKMLRGLELLKTVPTELEIRTTFIQENKDELDSIRALANRFTNRYAINVEVYKPIRGAVSDAENCRLTPAEITAVIQSNLNYYDRLNCANNDPRISEDVVESAALEYGFDIPPVILQCLAAKAMYWITWDGKMLPCGSFSTPYTLPMKEGFAGAWKRLPILCDEIRMPAQCLACEYKDRQCPNCPAIIHAEAGSYNQAPNYLCSIARERNRSTL